MYLLREVNSDIFTNMTLNNTQDCYVNGEKIPIGNLSNYDNLIDLEGEQDTTVIKLNPDSKYEYTVAKIEYGSIPGYRLTDLVFAGDLIANVGETLTSVLDKIKNMLGEFEYFYNLDGKFVF
jgi:hypothetical protein